MANAKAEQAQALYMAGHSLADIAQQLAVPTATVRSWKKRHGWGNTESATPATQQGNAVAFPAQRNATPKPPPKPKRGRKPTGKYDTADMVEKIADYIEATKDELPILKECCLLNGWDYDYVMKLQRADDALRQSIKKLLDWKEVRLERGGLTGKFNKTMVIFTLKQPAHGWRDKAPDSENNGDSVIFVDSEQAMKDYLAEHGDTHGE